MKTIIIVIIWIRNDRNRFGYDFYGWIVFECIFFCWFGFISASLHAQQTLYYCRRNGETNKTERQTRINCENGIKRMKIVKCAFAYVALPRRVYFWNSSRQVLLRRFHCECYTDSRSAFHLSVSFSMLCVCVRFVGGLNKLYCFRCKSAHRIGWQFACHFM